MQSHEILVPRLGVNDDLAIIVQLFFGSGEEVTKGEVICELETSKAVFEVVAPASGIIQWLFKEGDEVRNSSCIGSVS